MVAWEDQAPPQPRQPAPITSGTSSGVSLSGFIDPTEQHNPRVNTERPHTSIAGAIQSLSSTLVTLAGDTWTRLNEDQQIESASGKEPFTADLKRQAVNAELLLLYLHTSDRVAQDAFSKRLDQEASETLRRSFMSALIAQAAVVFVETLYDQGPVNEEYDERETQHDLLQLYNTRATQYGSFPTDQNTPQQSSEPFLTLAAIRLAEALDCPDNPVVIAHGLRAIKESITSLRKTPALGNTIGQVVAGIT